MFIRILCLWDTKQTNIKWKQGKQFNEMKAICMHMLKTLEQRWPSNTANSTLSQLQIGHFQFIKSEGASVCRPHYVDQCYFTIYS